jgi:hypothetical protein
MNKEVTADYIFKNYWYKYTKLNELKNGKLSLDQHENKR